MRALLRYLALMFITTMIVFCVNIFLIEVHLRNVWYKNNYNDPAINDILFYSEPLMHNIKDKVLSFRQYTTGAVLVGKADYRINNMNCFSGKDYTLEKGNNEYRIVVLGNEQTASSVADVSWPDYLEDELNRRDQKKRYKVLNLGWPDYGPYDYLKTLKENNKIYNPDLVILNYVETDFWRALPLHLTSQTGYITYRGNRMSEEAKKIYYKVDFSADESAMTVVNYIKGSDKDSIVSFAHPDAVPSRPYGFFSTKEFMSDINRVRILQKRIVEDMIKGSEDHKYGTFVVDWLKNELKGLEKSSNMFESGSKYLIIIKHILSLSWLDYNPKIKNVAEVRNFDPPSPEKNIIFDQKKMVTNFAKVFNEIRKVTKNIIITHNFNHVEYSQKTDWNNTNKMMLLDPSIKVIDMRKYVPIAVSSKEVRSWYLANMGEKWSNKGHRTYAKIMADIVMITRKEQAYKH